MPQTAKKMADRAPSPPPRPTQTRDESHSGGGGLHASLSITSHCHLLSDHKYSSCNWEVFLYEAGFSVCVSAYVLACMSVSVSLCAHTVCFDSREA